MSKINYPEEIVNKIFISFVGGIIISILSCNLGAFNGITLYLYPVKQTESVKKV